MFSYPPNIWLLQNRSLLTLSPSVESVLDTLSSSTTADFGSVQVAQSLDRLLPLENSMNEFGSQVEQIRSAMIEVLENDEDMSEMYLTDKMVTGKHDEGSAKVNW
mmetsp:Transcript_38985/g.154327  ORF Transcript_38985/g.154327 Transcript_38985/m.154327 type:complete len:105 (+) Transcript_38985:628-942(+)